MLYEYIIHCQNLHTSKKLALGRPSLLFTHTHLGGGALIQILDLDQTWILDPDRT